LDQCLISKDDITSAFPQLDYTPDSAMLLAVSIASELVLFHLVGNFGWTGFPMVFAVLGRALLRLIRPRLHGLVFLCCDDFMNFGAATDAQSDKFMVQDIVNTIIPDGISADKSVQPTLDGVDLLGWDFTLSRGCILPKQKGRDKLSNPL
jgi:hypothetical protein